MQSKKYTATSHSIAVTFVITIKDKCSQLQKVKNHKEMTFNVTVYCYQKNELVIRNVKKKIGTIFPQFLTKHGQFSIGKPNLI